MIRRLKDVRPGALTEIVLKIFLSFFYEPLRNVLLEYKC